MGEFKDKFVGFIDILGFKGLVENAESGNAPTLAEIIQLLEAFGSADIRDELAKDGPTICPRSRYVDRHLDFQLTQISDCAIISTEVSPAGAITLVNHCWKVVFRLLKEGILCRGHITRGPIHHTPSQPIGSGYHRAVEAEKNVSIFKKTEDERGTPFVEVDPVVCTYIAECQDPCVKKMFSRMTRSDSEGTAIFPFARLAHSFIISGFGHDFDPDKELRSNGVMRQIVLRHIEKVRQYLDPANPRAARKIEYYLDSLSAQLAICDKTDRAIAMFRSPFNT